MSMTRLVVSMFTAGLTVMGAASVSSQDYPTKPIRILTGAVGGGADFTARLVAQGISGPLRQQVIVENRASPVLAAEFVAKTPADGYTLLVAGGSVWIFALLQKAPFDIVRDFSPITQIEREVQVLVVHPSVPAKSIKELIALAKARPGALNYGSGASGGSGHLAGELFKSLAGVDIVHVPYKGNAPATTALISGEVQMTINDAGFMAPHVKSGKVRALAVTSAEPSALAPGLPTVAGSVPGYEMVGLTGIFAPAKTSEAVINRLNQEIVQFVNRPDVKERFINSSMEAVGSSPEQFAATIKSEIAKMAKVIKDAGIKTN